MDAFKLVYTRHCCTCRLRNLPDCEYKLCSNEQFNHWLKEAEKELRDAKNSEH